MSKAAARPRNTRTTTLDGAVDAPAPPSDSDFRGLVETALQGIIVHRDWEIVYANPAAARTLGYASVAELCSVDSLLCLIPEADHVTIRGYYDARRRGDPAPERYQARLVHKDGSIIWVEMLACAVSWQGCWAVQAAFVDISEGVRVRQMLRESEERYVLAMKGADEGMWDWHVDTDSVYVSPNVWRYMGMSPINDVLASRFWFERIHPDDRETYHARLIAHLRGETEFFQCEVRMSVHESSYRWFNFHALALRHENGRAYRVAGSLHDISQRKQAEKDLADRLCFDALLTRVSAEFITLPSSEVDATIERTLAAIGTSLEVDRGWYFQTNRHEPGLRYEHEWCAEGIRSRRDEDGMACFSAEGYPWTWAQLASGTPVVVSSPEDYPPEANAERQFATAHNVQSLISVFLDVDGAAVGVLGFETVNHTRSWSETVVNQLKLLDQVITDAVVRKRADTALRESRELLQTFLDNTPAVMTLKSLDNRYLLVNRGYEKILGRSRDAILDSTPWQMLTAEHASAVCAHDRQVLNSNDVVTRHQEIVHHDGARYWFRDTRFPVYGTDGKLIGVGCYSVDITELKQVEQALNERESLINAVSENLPGALYRRVLHTDGRLEFPYVSDSLYRVLGIDKDEVVDDAKVLVDAMHPEDRERWMRALEESAVSMSQMSVDVRIGVPGGRMHWMRSVARPRKLDDGTIVWDGLALDVTDEIDASEALRESEERFRNLVEGSLQGIAIVDRMFAPLFVNNAYATMFGYQNPEELLELGSHLDLFAPQDRELVSAYAAARLRGDEIPVAYELGGVRKDGCRLHMVGTLRLISWKGQPAFQITTTDISERKRTEARLKESQQQLRRLAVEISLAEEKERRRIASELHDSAIQDLALAKIKLGDVEKSCSAGSGKAKFDEVRALLGRSIHQARSLIFELSPPVLYELGLVAAVEWMAEQFESQHGIGCRVAADQGETGLRTDIEVVLFQVLRELLINVVKHANASRVDIELRRTNDNFLLRVSDDGNGFDADSITPGAGTGGFGLFNIRERLQLLGARLEIDSGVGTRVVVTIPWVAEDPGSAA